MDRRASAPYIPCMSIASSRITAKSQTTVPSAVRKALSLKPGDRLIYEARDGEIVLRKDRPLDVAYLRALQTTLEEWDTPEDAEAFDDL